MQRTRTRNDRPRSRADADRPTPTRVCLCERNGPLLVATFHHQQVTRLAREHWGFCPIPHQELSIGAYLTGQGEVPLCT